MTKAQEKALKPGDVVRIKDSAPLDAGEPAVVICRTSNGPWVKLDKGGSYTIPHKYLELTS